MTYDDWKTTPPELKQPEPELCECKDCRHEGYLDVFVECGERGDLICPDCAVERGDRCKECLTARWK